MSHRDGDPPSRNCPLSLCVGNVPTTLPVLCPNLKERRFPCGYIQPATIAPVVGGLPFLETIGMGSYIRGEFIALSEEDITSLKNLDHVQLENLSGGARRVSRIGCSLTGFKQSWKEDLDATLELTNCSRLQSCHMHMCVEDLKRCTQVVVPLLPQLEHVSVWLLPFSLSSVEIEDAAIETIKILHICDNPVGRVSLRCGVVFLQWNFIEQELDTITSIIETEGGSLEHTQGHGQVIECEIRRGTW